MQYHLNNPGECRSEWYSDQPDYQSGLQMPQLFEKILIAIECKVVSRLEGIHKAQLFSYMKTVGTRIGLLLNFGGAEPEFERLYFDPERQAEYGSRTWSSDGLPEGLLYPEITGNVLGAAIEVHRALGPGFIHRIYANACHHEYQLRGVGAEPRREYHVIFQGESIGSLKFNHFVIEGTVMHFPVAILTNFYDTAIQPIFART